MSTNMKACTCLDQGTHADVHLLHWRSGIVNRCAICKGYGTLGSAKDQHVNIQLELRAAELANTSNVNDVLDMMTEEEYHGWSLNRRCVNTAHELSFGEAVGWLAVEIRYCHPTETPEDFSTQPGDSHQVKNLENEIERLTQALEAANRQLRAIVQAVKPTEVSVWHFCTGSSSCADCRLEAAYRLAGER